MRDYQLQGLNWMVGLHHNGINGILADEMVGPICSLIFPPVALIMLRIGFGQDFTNHRFLGILEALPRYFGPAPRRCAQEHIGELVSRVRPVGTEL
jgi:uncharacterized membrane protein YqaE (UPF0057 family)